MKDSAAPKTPGQHSFERGNPWSRDPQFNGKFFWENQTAELRAGWETRAAEAADSGASFYAPLQFGHDDYQGPPVLPTPEVDRMVQRILRRT